MSNIDSVWAFLIYALKWRAAMLAAFVEAEVKAITETSCIPRNAGRLVKPLCHCWLCGMMRKLFVSVFDRYVMHP